MSKAYWNDVDLLLSHEGDGVMWLGDPVVRRRVNERVSGDPERWPTDWLREHLARELPLERAVSIGCGLGNLERDLARKGIVRKIVGVDLAPEPIEHARLETERQGLSAEQIEFVQGDAREFLDRQSDLDAVFFHGSLHHFDRLEDLLRRVEAALKPRGLLVVDEYVGPSMSDWGLATLFLPNFFYYLLPRKLRRVGRVRAPRNPDDPTEMICSAEIRREIERRFRVEAVRDYGGNLLSLIYGNLRRPGTDPAAPSAEEFRRGVEFLLRHEDRMMHWPGSLKRSSFHAVIVARSRVKPEAG